MEKQNSLLIVDDDASSLMELASILKQDYKIYAVKDGKPALEKAHEALPDLILLDVVMPGMNGFDVIAELKKTEDTKNIPVIFITGVNDSDSEREGLAIGAVDYIRKPFNAMVVKHRVRLQIQILNLQRELEEAANIATAANQSKSSFVANMSHEIRTPMNAIMGITDILLQNEERTTEETSEGLERIYASSEMLLDIINDILDFSKIEAGKLDILPSKYKLADMISDTVQLNVMRIEDKEITFELDIKEDIPARLVGDELRIKQILNNVLSNAFKYTEAGSVTLSIAYESEPSIKGISLVLRVKDTGSGMTKEQLDMLFDEYSRFNEIENRKIEGTGLGLSIMRLLVNLMHGSIHVESEPGKGTEVTIKLPQGIVDANILGKAAAEDLRKFRPINLKGKDSSKFKREPMPYGKVLIVDDTDTNLFVAVRFMEPYKLRIDTAVNGREALDIIESGKEYDVIFMDHMMPEMDGMEATKRLRESGYTHPIVALTANAMTGQAEMFLQNGFDEFISKPIDIQQLDSILVKLIRDRQPQDIIDAAREKANSSPEAEETEQEQLTEPALLNAFKSDANKALSVLNDLSKINGWLESESYIQRYITTVHNLKSTLKCIGEDELSEFALNLELAGREKVLNFIESETPGFIEKMRDLLEKLGQKRFDSKDDIDILCKKLHEIEEMCVEYDRKSVLSIIDEIENRSEKTSEVFDKIKEYALHSDFEEAGLLAMEYAAVLQTVKKHENGSADSPSDGTDETKETRKSGLINGRTIPGLDIRKGLKRFEGAEKAYLKTLRSFATGTLSTLAEMETVDESTLTAYGINVHGIKGSSYDINAKQLGKSAEALEDAAKAGDLSFVLENNPAFLESANKLINDIQDMLSAIDSENPKPKKDKPDEALLAKLIIACENYSMDDVDSVMAEIDEYQYEADDGLVKRIQNHIDLMQFPKVVKMLTKD